LLSPRQRGGQGRASDEFRNTDGFTRNPWISRFNIETTSAWTASACQLILLTTVLFFLSMIGELGDREARQRLLHALSILETGVLGSFFALDFSSSTFSGK